MTFERRRAVWASLWTALLLGTGLSAQEPPSSSAEADETSALDEVKLIAQRAALPHLGGEKPYVLRESSWSGEIAPGEAKLIQVHLFKRNDYHFWLAVPDRKAVVGVDLYNGRGERVEGERLQYASSNVASFAAGAKETGIYYLRISLQPTVETPQRWAVVYAYR